MSAFCELSVNYLFKSMRKFIENKRATRAAASQRFTKVRKNDYECWHIGVWPDAREHGDRVATREVGV